MKNGKKIFKYIMLALPMILGVAGYHFIDGQPILQSVYLSVKLYGFGADDLPPNAIIELARWIGPVATASSVVLVLQFLRSSVKNRFAYFKGDSTAVYGPAAEKTPLLKQLGSNAVDGKEKFVKAHKYILLDSEEKNLEFFDKHRDELADCEVYANCNALSAQSVSCHNLHLFCREEISASRFWKEYCIYSLSKSRDHKLKIAVTGFGKLGKELVLSALQNNIFSPNQQLDYHIWGDADGFCNIYHQLDQIGDNVIFHYKNWHEEINFINSCDMVIVLQQENQADLLRRLILATSCEKLYVFTASNYSTEILESSDRIVPYKWKKVADNLENILEITLFEKAKKINLRYAHLYGNTEETKENSEKEWQKLDTFTRYSNISAADYNDIQRLILKEENISAALDDIPADTFELLSELEHIRWCRYHYLNNWKHGKPADGNKDRKKRIHADLVPYSQLTEGEKDKDRENLRILFSIK